MQLSLQPLDVFHMEHSARDTWLDTVEQLYISQPHSELLLWEENSTTGAQHPRQGVATFEWIFSWCGFSSLILKTYFEEPAKKMRNKFVGTVLIKLDYNYNTITLGEYNKVGESCLWFRFIIHYTIRTIDEQQTEQMNKWNY